MFTVLPRDYDLAQNSPTTALTAFPDGAIGD